jgi:hypothetical protein
MSSQSSSTSCSSEITMKLEKPKPRDIPRRRSFECVVLGHSLVLRAAAPPLTTKYLWAIHEFYFGCQVARGLLELFRIPEGACGSSTREFSLSKKPSVPDRGGGTRAMVSKVQDHAKPLLCQTPARRRGMFRAVISIAECKP